MKKKLRYLFYSLLFFLPVQLFAQIATHVVMSQVFGGGGNTNAPWTNDFVELYNPTNADIVMTNWSVQYTSAAGTTFGSGTTIASFSGTIKAHGYFLIGLAAGATVLNKPLPATDATGGVNMSASAGKVALVNNSTVISQVANPTDASIVDFLGFYTAAGTTVTNGYETAVLTVPSTVTANTWAANRIANSSSTATTLAIGGSDATAGNGWDSNNNSTDFAVQTTITPKNSSSATLVVATSTATTPPAIDFSNTTVVGSSATQTFSVAGVNLTAGSTVAVTGPFTVSTDGGSTYGTSKIITTSQLATTTSTTTAVPVLVKFTPIDGNPATGTVTVSATGATSQIIALTGVGITATLTASKTVLAFGNINEGLASPPVLSYTLAGSNLGTNNTVVTATAPYTVSKSATSGFAASISFSSTEIAASPTVYVQFNPTATGAANITITAVNAIIPTGPSVSVTGTGVIPVLTAATNPVTAPVSISFGNQTVNTSAVKTYTLSGINLTAATTVAVTGTGYTISRTSSSAGFGTSVSFTAAELTATTAPTVWVNFTPTTIATLTGTITNTTIGTGATPVAISLTGTSIAMPVPALITSVSQLTFSQLLGSTQVAQSYTISGVNLTGATTVTAVAPYSISTSATGTYGTSLTFSTTQLASPQTVYVQFAPTAVGAANGSLTNATAGGSSQIINLIGTGVGIPVLVATPTTLSFTQSIAAPSAAQSFSLTGTYLTAATTTVTVAAPYQVSKDGLTNWGTSVSYTAADFPPTATATLNVYVRFVPTVIAPGGVNNGTATIASTGATSQTITLNGNGLGLPTLTAAPTTLTFAQAAGSTSVAQTYVLTGTYLTGNTTVATAAPYSISKDGVIYATTLTYTTAEFAAPQTVYVKFSPTTNGAIAGTITNTTPGATTPSITLNGTGGNSAPTLNVINDITICSTTTPQTIALAGITTGIETTQTYVVSVSTNNAALFSQIGVLPLTATTSQINYTLSAGTSGTAAITVKVQDNGGTANGGVDTYTRTFNININALPTASVTSDIGTTITKGSTAVLTAASGGTAYSWAGATGIISGQNTAALTVQPLVTTTYTVTVTNASGCTATQAVTITVNTFSPLVTNNILTPNGDGKNDTWIVQNITAYPTSSVKVIDKAGKTVYSKFNYQNDWDGTYNGQPLTQGTYYYVIDLGVGAPKYTGYITLIRN